MTAMAMALPALSIGKFFGRLAELVVPRRDANQRERVEADAVLSLARHLFGAELLESTDREDFEVRLTNLVEDGAIDVFRRLLSQLLSRSTAPGSTDRTASQITRIRWHELYGLVFPAEMAAAAEMTASRMEAMAPLLAGEVAEADADDLSRQVDEPLPAAIEVIGDPLLPEPARMAIYHLLKHDAAVFSLAVARWERRELAPWLHRACAEHVEIGIRDLLPVLALWSDEPISEQVLPLSERLDAAAMIGRRERLAALFEELEAAAEASAEDAYSPFGAPIWDDDGA